MMEVQPDVVIHDDLADDDGEAEEEEEEPRQRMEHPDDEGEFKNASQHCNPLQENYRVELLHREIPVVITGNEFT